MGCDHNSKVGCQQQSVGYEGSAARLVSRYRYTQGWLHYLVSAIEAFRTLVWWTVSTATRPYHVSSKDMGTQRRTHLPYLPTQPTAASSLRLVGQSLPCIHTIFTRYIPLFVTMGTIALMHGRLCLTSLRDTTELKCFVSIVPNSIVN